MRLVDFVWVTNRAARCFGSLVTSVLLPSVVLILGACTGSDSPEAEAADVEPTASTAIAYEAALEPVPDGTREGTETGLYRVMGADRGSDKVRIVVYGAECLELRRVEVEEQEAFVLIRAVMRSWVESIVTCHSQGIRTPVTITLEAPLGDRAVIGGCTATEENIAGRQCEAAGYVEP